MFGTASQNQRDFLCDDYEDLLFSQQNARFRPNKCSIAVARDDEEMRPVLDEILNFQSNCHDDSHQGVLDHQSWTFCDSNLAEEVRIEVV